MGLGEYQNSHELHALNAAAICYQSGDIDGAIGYVQEFAELIGAPMPKMPIVIQRGFRAEATAKKAYYFKSRAAVNRVLRGNVIQIRSSMKGPQVKVIGQT